MESLLQRPDYLGRKVVTAILDQIMGPNVHLWRCMLTHVKSLISLPNECFCHDTIGETKNWKLFKQKKQQNNNNAENSNRECVVFLQIIWW